jgi:hypothetical protein
MSFEDLELRGHFDILFFLMKTEVIPGRVQQPITYFIRPWNDFMIHGVNNLSTLVAQSTITSESLPQQPCCTRPKTNLDKKLLFGSWICYDPYNGNKYVGCIG